MICNVVCAMVKLRGIHRVGSYNYHEIPFVCGYIERIFEPLPIHRAWSIWLFSMVVNNLTLFAAIYQRKWSHPISWGPQTFREAHSVMAKFLEPQRKRSLPLIRQSHNIHTWVSVCWIGNATGYDCKYMGVSWGFHNGGTPKWMVYNGKSH